MKRSGTLVLCLIFLTSIMMQPVFAERPPDGYARPPIHTKPFARTSPTGLTPAQTRHAYGFDQFTNKGAGQTIAIVDAYDHPNIESDLAVFNSTFGLPSCTTLNGCFHKVYANGIRPRSNAGWALEIALDVEWAHAIAPAAKIVLVEASSNSFSDLLNAVDTAVYQGGASVVSMSWGGSEFSSEPSYDSHFMLSGVTFTASAGDSGNGGEYPAASPYVVSVGGTTLQVDTAGNYITETAWSGSGGGISSYETEPSYQSTYPIPNNANYKRGIPDVAYDGDPNTGFPVYDSVKTQGQSGWFQVGGTSAGAPQWAALFAIANSMRAAAGKGPLSSVHTSLYAIGGAKYHDVIGGSNGSCGAICTTGVGYDYVTGLGSPRADSMYSTIDALVAQ
jgi:subtilase family serine protease